MCIMESHLERIKNATQEILVEEELQKLLPSAAQLKHYIGFEISGYVHLGTGIVCMQKVLDIANAGIQPTIFLADYHTWINEKLGGDLHTINNAIEYFKHAIKASYQCVGGNSDDLTFVLGSDLYHHNDEYWKLVIEISKHITLSRMHRSIDILGRSSGGDIDFAKLIYPAMQAADIYMLGAHIVHAGSDQRKVHVIARDVYNQVSKPLTVNNTVIPPIAVHHELLLGLHKPSVWPIPDNVDMKEFISSMKMSKSNPASAVFVHDSKEDIRKKIMEGFCPEKETTYNPILHWADYFIGQNSDKECIITRPETYGGNMTFKNYKEVRQSFIEGNIHPEDFKSFVAEYVIDYLAPIREYFEQKEPKQALSNMNTIMQSIS